MSPVHEMDMRDRAAGTQLRLPRVLVLVAFVGTFSMAGLLTAASPASAAGTSAAGIVVAYPLLDLDTFSNYTASPSPDPHISVTVGGTAVNVQDNLGSAQTRFEMSDSPEKVVITDTAGVTSASVRPLAYGMDAVISGDSITFTLPHPEDFAVDINGAKDALLMFADPLEVNPPELGDSNVVNVMSFPDVNNNGVIETGALQAAIDYVSAHSSTTPILYFPAGVYRTATLEIGSNVQIYLSDGAVLLADPNESDYPLLPGTAGPTPTSAILAIRGASNVKIFGRGVVDGDGFNLHANFGQDMGIFDIFTDDGTNNLTVDDLMFTNSVMWQSDIQGAHDLTFDNVKFNNPQGNLGNEDDAFKVNGAYNLRFTKGWLSARDDTMTFAAVGTEAIYNTSNIRMSGTVLDSSGTPSASIRFADIGSGQTMTDMNVSNIYDISYGRGMTFRGDGGNSPYQNGWGAGTVLNNWDIESPAPLVWFGASGSANATISGITISNITTAGAGGGHIRGDSTNAWDNIHFSNIISGGVVASDLDSLGLATNSFATDVDVAADSPNADLAIPTKARPETTTTTSIASGYRASDATDGAFDTFFKSASSPSFPQALTVRWPIAHSLSGVTVVCDHCQGQAPTNWNVQVSPNGRSDWTTVGSSGNVSWQHDDNSYESHLVSFPAQTGEGVRIQISSANNEFGQYQIDELEVTPANSAPTAAASTTSIASGDSASAANSGLWDSSFKSAASPTFPQYLTLQWPMVQTVGAVTLVCDHCRSQAPTNWDVQASLGGVSGWTTVARSGNVTWSGPSDGTRQTHVIMFSPVTAMALRLQINHANLAGGRYQIDQVETMPTSATSTAAYVNRSSDLCLDDPNGSTTPTTLVDVERCGGGAMQQFTYHPATETLTADGLCLGAEGAGDSPGTQVELVTCLSGPESASQRWTNNANGQIVGVESALCLQESGAAGGDGLQLETCTNPTIQTYTNGSSGLCLNDPSTAPSTFGDVEGCNGGASQQLAYDPVLQTLMDQGLCMDSFGGGASPGTPVDFYTCHAPEPSQEWTVNASDQIVSGESGLCVQETGTTSGDQLELENCDASNPAQIWTPSNQGQTWSRATVQPYANGSSGLCLNDPSTAPSTFGDVEGCNGGASQQLAYDPVLQTLMDQGLCMDSFGGGASPGTPVDFYTCHAPEPSQEWTVNASDQIVSGESGLCVQETGTTSGDQLELENCDASNPAQIWVLPT